MMGDGVVPGSIVSGRELAKVETVGRGLAAIAPVLHTEEAKARIHQ